MQWRGADCVYLSSLLFVVGGCSRYVDYVPVRLVTVDAEARWSVDESLNSLEHRKAVAEVLEGYRLDYRWNGERLLISRHLRKDTELLGNMTEKALDVQLRRAARNKEQPPTSRQQP